MKNARAVANLEQKTAKKNTEKEERERLAASGPSSSAAGSGSKDGDKLLFEHAATVKGQGKGTIYVFPTHLEWTADDKPESDITVPVADMLNFQATRPETKKSKLKMHLKEGKGGPHIFDLFGGVYVETMFSTLYHLRDLLVGLQKGNSAASLASLGAAAPSAASSSGLRASVSPMPAAAGSKRPRRDEFQKAAAEEAEAGPAEQQLDVQKDDSSRVVHSCGLRTMMDEDQHERSDEMSVKVLAHKDAPESVLWPPEAVKRARHFREMLECAPGSSDGGVCEVRYLKEGLSISGNQLVRDLCATANPQRVPLTEISLDHLIEGIKEASGFDVSEEVMKVLSQELYSRIGDKVRDMMSRERDSQGWSVSRQIVAEMRKLLHETADLTSEEEVSVLAEPAFFFETEAEKRANFKAYANDPVYARASAKYAPLDLLLKLKAINKAWRVCAGHAVFAKLCTALVDGRDRPFDSLEGHRYDQIVEIDVGALARLGRGPDVVLASLQLPNLKRLRDYSDDADHTTHHVDLQQALAVLNLATAGRNFSLRDALAPCFSDSSPSHNLVIAAAACVAAQSGLQGHHHSISLRGSIIDQLMKLYLEKEYQSDYMYHYVSSKAHGTIFCHSCLMASLLVISGEVVQRIANELVRVAGSNSYTTRRRIAALTLLRHDRLQHCMGYASWAPVVAANVAKIVTDDTHTISRNIRDCAATTLTFMPPSTVLKGISSDDDVDIDGVMEPWLKRVHAKDMLNDMDELLNLMRSGRGEVDELVTRVFVNKAPELTFKQAKQHGTRLLEAWMSDPGGGMLEVRSGLLAVFKREFSALGPVPPWSARKRIALMKMEFYEALGEPEGEVHERTMLETLLCEAALQTLGNASLYPPAALAAFSKTICRSLGDQSENIRVQALQLLQQTSCQAEVVAHVLTIDQMTRSPAAKERTHAIKVLAQLPFSERAKRMILMGDRLKDPNEGVRLEALRFLHQLDHATLLEYELMQNKIQPLRYDANSEVRAEARATLDDLGLYYGL